MENKKKTNKFLGTLKAAFDAITHNDEKKVPQSVINRAQFSMTRYQWYLNSGMARKNNGWKRKTNKFKSNFISNRKVF